MLFQSILQPYKFQEPRPGNTLFDNKHNKHSQQKFDNINEYNREKQLKYTQEIKIIT